MPVPGANKTPEVDIATQLAAAFSPTLTIGTDIKYGPRESIATPGNDMVWIWILPYGGAQSEPLIDITANGQIYSGGYQVIVLSPPDDKATGLARARQVRDALNRKPPAGYIDMSVDHSEPLYLGPIPEAAGIHEWSVNVTAKWLAIV